MRIMQATTVQAPPAPAPPASPPAVPGAQGTPAPAPLATSGAAEMYQALRAQRRELANQLERLEERRTELGAQLRDPQLNEIDRRGLEQRLVEVDKRIVDVESQIAAADAQVARAAAVPGATVEPPAPPRTLLDDDIVIPGMVMTFALLVPVSLAWARRLWKKAAVVSVVPREMFEQLGRLEQSVDAIAVEVERLGEGQRFMARVMTEEGGSRALGAGAAEPIAVPRRESVPEQRR
jgi:hypothetical protein